MCGGEGRGDLRDHAALGERRQQRRGREGVERQQRVLRVVRHAQRLDLMRGNKENREEMRGNNNREVGRLPPLALGGETENRDGGRRPPLALGGEAENREGGGAHRWP